MTAIEEKISVIIPAYNCRDWIGRCLDSVLDQTYQSLEIVVIDDGSDDGSAEIIEHFMQKDSRIRYFFQKNRGEASARKHGIMEAAGSVVAFVDADDYIEKDMYEKMMAVMREQGADIVECSCRKVSPGGRVLQNNELKEETVVGKRRCVKHYLRQKNVANYLCNKIYRKELFHDLRIPVLKYSVDYYINAIVHARAEKKIILSHIFYNYRLHEGQVTDARHVSLSGFDRVLAGRLVVQYFRKDRELRTYAAVYACDYAVCTARQYLCCYPDRWQEVRKHIKADFLYCYIHMASVADADIDVMAKRKQYMRFFLKGEISRGILPQALPELAQKEKQHEKCSRLLKLMCRWTMNVQKGICVADFLRKREWHSVAVYGAGEVGKCLLAELSDTDIEVRYVIDRRRIELDLPVYSPDDRLSAVDCVIVTAVTNHGEIRRSLKDKMDCPVISIEEIVYHDE